MRPPVPVLTRLPGVLLCWCVVSPLACGKTREISERPGSEPHYSGKARPVARAYCEYSKRCDDHAWEVHAGGTLEGCIDYWGCVSDADRWGIQVGSSDSQIQACATALRELECGASGESPLPEVCRKPPVDAGPPLRPGSLGALLAGDIPVGEPCLASMCETDLYCEIPESVEIVAGLPCGTCAPRIAIGGLCSFRAQCHADARCIDGTCQPPRSSGDACGTSDECELGFCEDGRCAEYSWERAAYDDLIGRPCDEVRCEGWPSLACVDNRCQSLPDEGERCSTQCRRGQVCVDELCVYVGCTIEPGEPCSYDCEGYCDREAKLCKPRGEEGDACDESDSPLSFPCAVGTCRNGVCVAPLENGEVCSNSTECRSQYCAREPACTPALPSGLLCTASLSGDGVCAAYPSVEECAVD